MNWSVIVKLSVFLTLVGCRDEQSPSLTPEQSAFEARIASAVSAEVVDWEINGANAFGRLIVTPPLEVKLRLGPDSSLTGQERRELFVVILKEGATLPTNGWPAEILPNVGSGSGGHTWYGSRFVSLPPGRYMIQIGIQRKVEIPDYTPTREGAMPVSFEPIVSSKIIIK